MARIKPVITTTTITFTTDIFLCFRQLNDDLLKDAKTAMATMRSDYVTLLLRDRLHWLRVPEHVTHFKLCLQGSQQTGTGIYHELLHPDVQHSKSSWSQVIILPSAVHPANVF